MNNNGNYHGMPSHVHRHGHDHRHQHEHSHRTAVNQYGMRASALAELPMEALLRGTEELNALLFREEPYGQREKVPVPGGEPEYVQVGEADVDVADHDLVITTIVARLVKSVEDQCERQLLMKLALRLIDPYQKDQEICTLHRLWLGSEPDILDYGRLIPDLEVVAVDLGVDPQRLMALRDKLASHVLPMGLGWRSQYEYQNFLARHLFHADTNSINPAEQDQYRSFRLKASLESELGPEARDFWDLLVSFTQQRLEMYEQGRRPGVRRSPRALAREFDCSEEMAARLIRFFPFVPKSPLEDLGILDHRNRRRRTVLRRIEANLVWDEQAERYYSRWAGRIAARVEALQSRGLSERMRLIKCMLAMREEQARDPLSVVEEVRSADPALLDQLGHEELSELADALLQASGDTDLVRDCAEIESRLFGDPRAQTETAKEARLKERLVRLQILYFQLMEAYTLKPKLIEYVANYQKAFLRSGDILDLKRLTKRMVVEALGFLPGGGSSTGLSDEDRRRKNIGRRLERYMSRISVTLEDGKVIVLQDLIPGGGGALDLSGEDLSKPSIKEYIQEIIASEPAQRPHSDQRISEILIRDYAVKCARRTVAKYREELGIPSSQGRRGPWLAERVE